jgi:NAD(P)-dependent dehydrogenase (short-subunit alcohol dehydrogenase family)
VTVSAGATYVITGGSDGIGLECASQVAADHPGCRLVIVGRDPSRTAAAVGRLRAEQPACRVDSLLCDFTDLDAVRRLARDLLATCDRIDVLVNNAGTAFARRRLTDGVEATFVVNHLAGFLLTSLLVDRLKESAPARVVFTASAAHFSASLDLDDLAFEHGYTIMRAYNRSKLANVLTTRRLARDLEGTGVTVNAVHPGAVATNLWSSAPWFARPALAVIKRWKMESPHVGGSRLAYVVTSPDLEGRTGGYYSHDRLREPSELARDDALGDRLYDVSARLVGLR